MRASPGGKQATFKKSTVTKANNLKEYRKWLEYIKYYNNLSVS
jgi:hypothetical protein